MNYIIQLSPDANIFQIKSILHYYKINARYTLLRYNTIVVEQSDLLEQALDKFKNFIISIEEDIICKEVAIPNDPNYSSQWFLPRIRAPQAWDIFKGEGAKVAVLDSGVDQHVDLAGNLLPGWCLVTDTSDTSAVRHHGTQVSSVAAAVTDNDTRIAGVGWNGKVVPLRGNNVAELPGVGASMIAEAVIWCMSNDVRVINFSMATTSTWNSIPAITSALLDFRKYGGVVVTALDNIFARYDFEKTKGVIYIAGTDANNNIVTSGYGPILDLVAPSSSIPTLFGISSYSSTSWGNSFAVPQVAMTAAMILALRPELGTEDVIHILRESANDTINPGWVPGFQEIKGYGLLDMEEAFNLTQTWIPLGKYFPRIVITEPGTEVSVPKISTTLINAEVWDDNIISKAELFINNILTSTNLQNLTSYDFSPLLEEDLNNILIRVTDNIDQTGESQIILRGLAYDEEVFATEYLEPYLEPGVEYELQVCSFNSGGDGPFSTWVSASLSLLAPNLAPIVIQQTLNNVAYQPAPWATSHEYRLNGGAWSPILSNPFSLQGAQNGDILEVRGVNSQGVRLPSEPITFESVVVVPQITFIPTPLAVGQSNVNIIGVNFGN